nr:alpha/beta hydrolase [Bradyrhizobium genosp. SA-3]
MAREREVTHVSHHEAELGDVRIHYVTAGSGPPLVLLHGWPQTWYTWRHVIGELADQYFIVAPDLRGLGDSSRPVSGYDKRTIADDVWRVISCDLELQSFYLVGHDWGGPVAYALAVAHPEAVSRLAILDVTIPGDGTANFSQSGKRWHHGFHATRDLPETLIAGREDVYLEWFFRNFGATPTAVSPDDIAEYLRTYRMPGALRAGFEYYRALERDTIDNRSNPRLEMPVLALGGACSWGRGLEVVESLRRVARDVRGGVVEGAGHWIPEEQPAQLAKAFQTFFKENRQEQLVTTGRVTC